MSSNTIRGIRRKKSSLSEVKIVVLGAPGVGKTAITVRFLTKRYIGEYDHQTENRYKSEIMVDGEPVIFEVLDSCSKEPTEMPRDEIIQWADGFLLIYSITDRASFNLVKTLRQHIYDVKQFPKDSGQNGSPQFPIVIVANKSDLIHLRQERSCPRIWTPSSRNSLLQNMWPRSARPFMTCAEKSMPFGEEQNSRYWTECWAKRWPTDVHPYIPPSNETVHLDNLYLSYVNLL